MKRILILIILVAPLACWRGIRSEASAQDRFDASLFAGLNMCQIDGDASAGYNHPGLRAGVGTSFILGDIRQSSWRMAIELAFTNKGSYIEDYYRSLSVSYIEMPVMLVYSAMNDRLRLAAGVAPGVRVAAKVTNDGADDQLSADNFTAFDWLPLTASISYRFSDHLGIEGRYQNSMLSITRKTGSGTYQLFRSNIGCFHNLVSVGAFYRF